MRARSQDELVSMGASLKMPWATLDDELAWRDAIRAHVASEGFALRRSLLDRTLRWHAIDERDEGARERLNEWIDDLDAVGDLFVGDDGLVGAAPLRAALVHGTSTALLLGSVTTPMLASALPREVIEGRRVRRVVLTWHDRDALAAALEPLGGTVTDAARWSGLDRAPPTLDAWMSELAAKRPREDDAATLIDDPSAERFVVRDGRGRWRARSELSRDELVLVRVRQVGGWFRFAWRTESGCVSLTSDEAARTALAIEQRAGASRTVTARSTETGGVAFTLPVRVPRAEYRMLLGTADRVDADGGAQYVVGRDVWTALRSMLRDRLGLLMDEVGVLR